MENLFNHIGRHMIDRAPATERLYRLEEDVQQALKRAAEEHEALLNPDALDSEEAKRYALAEELFVLLDYFRPESIPAATAFLQRYGREASVITDSPRT